MLQVGRQVIAKHTTAVCQEGEHGVCYEIYTLDNRPGYSIQFKNGGYDGFSSEEVIAILNVTGSIYEPIENYQFTNVIQLQRDYENGQFKAALE